MVSELCLEPIPGTQHFSSQRVFHTITPLRQFSVKSDFDEVVASCVDPGGWSQAIGMMEATSDKGRRSGHARAVYIMGVEGEEKVSKIGVSANPIKRVADIQGSHYRKLFLHGIIFTPKRNAVAVEQGVLGWADDGDYRMMGEWLSISPEEALKEAICFASSEGIPIVDGKTWFEDMVMRTRDIARRTKFRNAA